MKSANEIKKSAYTLGRKAFFVGAMRVPGFDQHLSQIGFSVQSTTAWLNGWDAANIEAMMADAN